MASMTFHTPVVARAVSVETPDGVFSIIASDIAVLASGWTAELEQLRSLIHPSIRPHTIALMQEGELDASGVLASAARAVTAYYGGDVYAPSLIPVEQHSGPFRMAAWETLRAVAPGQVLSYTEYAERCGNARAVRAAASACATNAAALFVPCHRITRNDGSVGQFRYGAQIKSSLLTREAMLSS